MNATDVTLPDPLGTHRVTCGVVQPVAVIHRPPISSADPQCATETRARRNGPEPLSAPRPRPAEERMLAEAGPLGFGGLGKRVPACGRWRSPLSLHGSWAPVYGLREILGVTADAHRKDFCSKSRCLGSLLCGIGGPKIPTTLRAGQKPVLAPCPCWASENPPSHG